MVQFFSCAIIITAPGLEIERFCAVPYKALPSVRKLKSLDAAISSEQTRDTYKTHTDKEKKPQGAATFRDDATLRYKPFNFWFPLRDFYTFVQCY
jgi:hypothetical protein